MNSKALAFFILAIAAIGLGLYSYSNESAGNHSILNLKDISLKGIKDLPTGLATYFSKYHTKYVLANMKVNGTFDGIVDIKNINTNAIICLPSGKSVRIGGINYKITNPQTLHVYGLKGKAEIIGAMINIKGYANKLETDTGEISSTTSQPISLQYNGTFRYLYLQNATEENMVVPNFKGKITMYLKGDTIDYIVGKKYIDFVKYYGNLNMTSTKIILNGEGIIESDVFFNKRWPKHITENGKKSLK